MNCTIVFKHFIGNLFTEFIKYSDFEREAENPKQERDHYDSYKWDIQYLEEYFKEKREEKEAEKRFKISQQD